MAANSVVAETVVMVYQLLRLSLGKVVVVLAVAVAVVLVAVVAAVVAVVAAVVAVVAAVVLKLHWLASHSCYINIDLSLLI